MSKRKGIVLAGGSGTRLYPATVGISKQLLPVYDKPMIYYPLSILMLAGITEIAIITTPEDNAQFKRVLGDGSQWGICLTYLIQAKPEGLAQAYVLAESFLDGSSSALILGDNIFYGHNIVETLESCSAKEHGATVFGYQVSDPERYGVVAFDTSGKVTSIVEKPSIPSSNYAVTGLYFLDNTASAKAHNVKKSQRGELEITSLLAMYLEAQELEVKLLGRGTAWLDTGTHSSLLDASNFVRTVQERQGLQIGCLEEIGLKRKIVDISVVERQAAKYSKNSYGSYLKRLTIEETDK